LTLPKKLMEELHTAYPQNISFKNGLAISYQYVGVTQSYLGDLDLSLFFLKTYNKLEQELYDEYPENVSFKNGLAISYSRLGEIHNNLQNYDSAFIFYEKDFDLTKDLYKTFPQNVTFKNGLAISYTKLGEMYIKTHNLNKASIYFSESIKMFEGLLESHPKQFSYLNSLAISYFNLGETYSLMGDIDKAIMFYEKELHIKKTLYSGHSEKEPYKNTWAMSYSKIGSTQTPLVNLDKGEVDVPSNRVTRSGWTRSHYEVYPQTVSLKKELANSYLNLGQLYRIKKHDKEKAQLYFKEYEVLWQELAKDYSKFKEFKYNAVRRLQFLSGEANVDNLELYARYGELCDTLRLRIAQDPSQKSALAKALNSRAWQGFFLKKFQSVEADIREGLALGTENKYLHTNLAPALLLQGKYEEAMAEYKKWKDRPFGERGFAMYGDAFLDDLNIFEKAGIIPAARAADVEAVRKILSEK